MEKKTENGMGTGIMSLLLANMIILDALHNYVWHRGLQRGLSSTDFKPNRALLNSTPPSQSLLGGPGDPTPPKP